MLIFCYPYRALPLDPLEDSCTQTPVLSRNFMS